MTDLDRNLRQQIRKESDDMLFSRMELSDEVKRKIRQQAAAEKPGRRLGLPKAWMAGAAAVVAAVVIIAGYPMLQQTNVPAPAASPSASLPAASGGAAGSELSPLVTTPLGSVEDAKAGFGPDLLVPKALPEGFSLTKMETVGMENEPARDVIFTYVSGDKTVTFVASRSPAAFPAELFTKTQVGDADGFVFAQPELTELFWTKDGIQYSVTGQLSAEDTMKFAESVGS